MPSTGARSALAFLSRRPVVATVAFLTLALGVGANTAVFSVLDALLLRPLPYAEPATLVVPRFFDRATGAEWDSVSFPDYLDWRRQEDLFEQAALYYATDRDLTGAEEPEKLDALLVSEDYFPLARARPVLGRLLRSTDFEPGAEKVVVLGEGLWRRRFGGRPELLGQSVRLDGVPHTVVGVVDPKTTIPSTPALWLPLDLGHPVPDDFLRRDNYFVSSLLRVRSGVSFERAASRVAALADRVARELPAKRGTIGCRLRTLQEVVVGPRARSMLALVFATVFLVLVVACFNVANLLLVRAVDRRPEMAVRLALGARRHHLVRLLLGEALVLALASGASGVALAVWLTTLLRTHAPADLPGLAQLGLHGTVVGFALALSCSTVLVTGLLPAWELTRVRLSDGLRQAASRTVPGGRRGQRIRSALVVSEVAFSLVLLVAAGLMIRSLERLTHRPTGLEVASRLTFTVDLPRARYPGKSQRDALFVELLERLRANPRVKAASASSMIPLGGGGVQTSRVHLVEGGPEPPRGPEYRAEWNVVTPEYFRTVGLPILRGRAFSGQEDAHSKPVVIINQALAERMFPRQDPIGRRIRSWRDENLPREVVGVVSSVRFYGLGEEWQPMVYVPYQQVEWPRLYKVAVHTEGDPARLAAEAREAVRSLDDQLPVTEILTMEAIAAGSVARERYLTWVLGGLGSLALVLAALGLYGVVSYSVAQRTPEIGLRLALGARTVDVLRLVLRYGLTLALVGSAIGVVGALAVSRWLSSLLAGIAPTDPATYLGVSGLLTGVSVLASLAPARRAARVEPSRTLG